MQMQRLTDNDAIIMALIALESAQEATYHHSVRTANVAEQIAAKVDCGLYLTPNEVRNAALLHDIGKLNVPVQILEKKGALTAREKETIFHHPIWGERILLSFTDQRLRNLARFVLEHHELPDGSGYPSRLTLDEIDPVSRVINIADRFAAMTENRPYRKAVVPEFVIGILREDIRAFFGNEAGKVIEVLAEFDAELSVPRHAHDTAVVQAQVHAFTLQRQAAAG
jgi:putative nucleotidyltransferase with HDIG domain